METKDLGLVDMAPRASDTAFDRQARIQQALSGMGFPKIVSLVDVLTQAVNGLLGAVEFSQLELGLAYGDMTDEAFNERAKPYRWEPRAVDIADLAFQLKLLFGCVGNKDDLAETGLLSSALRCDRDDIDAAFALAFPDLCTLSPEHQAIHDAQVKAELDAAEAQVESGETVPLTAELMESVKARGRERIYRLVEGTAGEGETAEAHEARLADELRIGLDQIERGEKCQLVAADFFAAGEALGRTDYVAHMDEGGESRAGVVLGHVEDDGRMVIDAVGTLAEGQTLEQLLNEPPAWMLGRSVEARNALQRSGHVHPYTCATSTCRSSADGGILTAVEGGWLCEVCGYKQVLGDGEKWPFVVEK